MDQIVMTRIDIRRLDAPEAKARMDELTDILLDCVAGGAGVSFMANMTRDEARAFWEKIAAGVASGARVLLVAEQVGRLVGTVQVLPSGIPNQPHRADLSKMLVHRKARNKGVGAALLKAAEAEALKNGWWLLVLDTAVDSAGDRLYARGGWNRVGIIPNYALWPDGRLCPTRYYYKDLRASEPITIMPETPDQPDVARMQDEADALSAALYPADSNHRLPLSALVRPDIHFLVARKGKAAVGCGALKSFTDGSGEIKSMWVDVEARGSGVAAQILAQLEAEARRQGLRHLKLETGVYSAPAIALYRKNGFLPCEAFPPYKPDPFSVFMQKIL
jgi:GNAT superfamily N-acetyltransferase